MPRGQSVSIVYAKVARQPKWVELSSISRHLSIKPSARRDEY
jgi:hypothetical protein